MNDTDTTFSIADQVIEPGTVQDIKLPISEMYTGVVITLPVRVIRAKKKGPTVFLTAAVHGDEVNGTGIIRQFIFESPPTLEKGTLICVPVVNIFGFESNSRYLPDRRDLNRSFPGSPTGSLAGRFADVLMREIITKCDVGIDLHSAAEKRTNFPNIRGDFRNPKIKELAQVFGCELMVNGKGPEGSMRRAACDVGCPTIILEAGEVGKIEPNILKIGLRGITNVLIHLGMLDGEQQRPVYQTTVNRTSWVRAELGGLLRFHVAPGELVKAGQPLATNESVFGEARAILISPRDGIILGMATHPAVKPGEPVCHIAAPGRRLSSIRKALKNASQKSLAAKVRDDLATNIVVSPTETDED